ncbi:alpha/beta fold hydrolase [Microbacterium sp. A84]|uniref:alpha/beta fold hydrolase n=1 Tax=Microbacterium sp. A84 TaxID=3450715 RepID=UPI003F432633
MIAAIHESYASPRWFEEALSHTPVDIEVALPHRVIACRAWGPTDGPLVVLVHGGTAHQRWWDHIAPGLADGRRVITYDMAGHGDAPWQEAYSYESWAQELAQLVDALSPDRPSTLIGHSMGGVVALMAAQSSGSRVQHAITIDSRVRQDGDERVVGRDLPDDQRHRPYRTVQEAFARFRTLPPTTRAADHVLAHVAKHSIRETAGGWVWKFDPLVRAQARSLVAELTTATCPTLLLRADDGLLDDERQSMMQGLLGPLARTEILTDCGHHVPLDRPLELIETIRAEFDRNAVAPLRGIST